MRLANLKIVSNEVESDSFTSEETTIVIDVGKISQIKNPLAKRLIDFQRESGKSWNSIVRRIAINENILRYYLADKSVVNKKEIDEKVKAFLNSEERYLFALPKNLLFCETQNSRIIREFLRKCIYFDYNAYGQPLIAFIAGGPGYGKSTAARIVSQEIEGSAYFELNPECKSRTGFLKQMADKFSNYSNRDNVQRLKSLIDAFSNYRVLILDQGDNLNLDALDVVRTISEQSGISLCLLGLPNLIDKLRNSNKPEIIQLRDRINIFYRLNEPTKEDFFNVVNLNWFGLSDDLINDFIKYSEGSMRMLSNIIRNAREYFAGNEDKNLELDKDIIFEAYKLSSLKDFDNFGN